MTFSNKVTRLGLGFDSLNIDVLLVFSRYFFNKSNIDIKQILYSSQQLSNSINYLISPLNCFLTIEAKLYSPYMSKEVEIKNVLGENIFFYLPYRAARGISYGYSKSTFQPQIGTCSHSVRLLNIYIQQKSLQSPNLFNHLISKLLWIETIEKLDHIWNFAAHHSAVKTFALFIRWSFTLADGISDDRP